MDLGVVGLEGLVGSSSETGGFVLNPLSSSDPDSKHKKCYGSGFLKPERSGIEDDLLLWRGSKIAKIDEEQRNNDNSNSNDNNSLLLLRSNNNNNNGVGVDCDSTLFDGHQQQHQQQMLSFSTPKSETLLVEKSSSNATLLCSYNTLSRYSRNSAGYSSGNNIMHGAIIRGAFTPSQWMELEHQALIYKYITANVPVPSHLLIPIRKALHSAAFCSFSNGLLRPNALGWGAFHLGYSNSTDPEPGRCRRTDGKKWRCSRDAVVDQKYCERHMNRGRHRSRKPVEGQSNGHALTNPNTNTSSSSNNNNNGDKVNGSSASSSSSSFSIVGLGNNASNNIISFGGHNQEPKNMHSQHSLASDASAANSINRVFMNHHHKHQIQYEEESSSRNNNIEFGLVTSDSLLNPSQKSTTTTTLLPTSTFTTPSSTTTESQNHSLRNFIDDCPKIQSDNRTTSEFMPLFTPSSQNNDEKVALSPLRLSSRELELDPIQMGLGVGTCGGVNVNNTRPGNNWMFPVTWESSMCGPLGEVLNLSNSNNNNYNANNNKNSCSGLNLMMSDGNWDNNNNNNSPNSIGSSPSGVLMQKTAFGSVSNSSAGSSPRAENKKKVLHHQGASLCNDDLLV